jgi:hypothetical protein
MTGRGNRRLFYTLLIAIVLILAYIIGYWLSVEEVRERVLGVTIMSGLFLAVMFVASRALIAIYIVASVGMAVLRARREALRGGTLKPQAPLDWSI